MDNLQSSAAAEPNKLLFTSDVSSSTKGFSASSFDNDNVCLRIIFPFLQLKNKKQQN